MERRLALGFVVGVAIGMATLATNALAAGPKELVVFEATSLKDAFTKLGERFENDHPGVEVIHNAAGSQELRTQLEHGARADVFASADLKHMDAVAKAGLVAGPASVFTCNEPVVVVRPALAATIRSLADLPRAERIVIGTPEVPIGAYTLKIVDKAAGKYGADFGKNFQAKVASRELNVRQVLAKVVLGEADAGIVYRSDALAAKAKVVTVGIPAELNVTAQYPIAALKTAPRADLAKQWIELVRSPAGAAVLVEAGFSTCMGP